ncbi:Cyclic nucleotide-binding domain protein [Candidatus Magnetomorum sp. HK-1]|nr:Cyclic nucleotide-binding domain protein [Candidatus Magnetomorum sp. HK-1]
MNRKDKVDIQQVREFEIFQGLMTREIQIILEVSQSIFCSAGQDVLKQAELSMDLFLIISGRLNVSMVYSSMNERRMQKIAVLKSGDIFGEIGFLEGKRRSANITSIDDSLVLKIDGMKLHELFEINQHTGYVMMRNIALVIARRLVDINFQLRNTDQMGIL